MTRGRPDMRPDEQFSQRITPHHPSGDLEYSFESIKNPGLSVWLEKCAACSRYGRCYSLLRIVVPRSCQLNRL